MNSFDEKENNTITQGVIRWMVTSLFLLILVAASLFISAGFSLGAASRITNLRSGILAYLFRR